MGTSSFARWTTWATVPAGKRAAANSSNAVGSSESTPTSRAAVVLPEAVWAASTRPALLTRRTVTGEPLASEAMKVRTCLAVPPGSVKGRR